MTKVCALLLSFVFASSSVGAEPARVLVFSKTAGFRHTSIEPGIKAIRSLGRDHDLLVDATEDAQVFTSEQLAKYAAIVFLSTTQDVLNVDQEAALQRYVRNGGGFVGIHAASDTEYDWPWYGKLVGGRFDGHDVVQPAAILPVRDFGAAKLPSPWRRTDEWYNFKEFSNDVTVILKLDTNTVKGSKHPGSHPIAWFHEFEGGRVFYTGLGHTDESYSEPLFLAHLLDGINYAIGRTTLQARGLH